MAWANSELRNAYERRRRAEGAFSEYQSAYRTANRARLKTYLQNYQQTNRERLNAAGRERKRLRAAERYAEDPLFKLKLLIGSQMRKALKRKGGSKAGRAWQDLVGYSVVDLRAHLEAQFEWWMDWGNHGLLWEIDHIRQVAAFKLPEQIRECWALSNLRPLQKEINRSRHVKVKLG